MYLSLYVMLLVVKATTIHTYILHVNVTVCNAAAIMLLSLCVNVIHIRMYLLFVCNFAFSKSCHYAVV